MKPPRQRRSACCPKVQPGFTLIETLIALVVAATAAAIILSQLRGLIARVEQERVHELAVFRLLNDSARFSLGFPGVEVVAPLDSDTLQVRYHDPAWPVVTVRNFSATGEAVPPLLLAYTPFQLYSLNAGSYGLSVVAPGIRRPDAIMPTNPDSARDSAAQPAPATKALPTPVAP